MGEGIREECRYEEDEEKRRCRVFVYELRFWGYISERWKWTSCKLNGEAGKEKRMYVARIRERLKESFYAKIMK